MPRSRRTTVRAFATVACVAALAVAALSGCSGKKAASTPTTGASGGALPAAADLLSQSETAMSTVQTVHFNIAIDGTLANLPINGADGDLTKAGDAKGTATVSLLGASVEASFVIVNKVYYFKGPTGGFQQLSASEGAALFDPSAILDPNRGVVALMKTAQNPMTLASEAVAGHPAYKVSLTPDPTAVAALVPGAPANTTGVIWIDATSHNLVKGAFTVPATATAKAATVTITLTNFNAPVTVSAP